MTRNILLMTAATALSTILLTGAAMAQVSPFATTTLTAASSAAVFNATITIDGSKTTLPNQVVASGKALPLYNETTNKASYTKMETFDLLTMNATAGKLVSTARAVSTASGGLTSSASASIGSLKVVFSSPLGTALSISGSKIVATASFAATKSGKPVTKLTTTIGDLDIDGTGLGIGTLHFSGTPDPSKPYQNAAKTITITGFKQTVTKTAAGKATSVTVDALAIHIADYSVAGHTISGDIEIDPVMAN